MSDFNRGAVLSVREHSAQTSNGLMLPWTIAHVFAGRPQVEFVRFNGGIEYQQVFGGAVVAVENDGQRVYMPVVDQSNQPVPLSRITSVRIAEAWHRCASASIAITNGVGMCLQAGYDDSTSFLCALTELGKKRRQRGLSVGNLVRHHGSELNWAMLVTLMRLTDPESRFELMEVDNYDEASDKIEFQPMVEDSGGHWVCVVVTYHGKEWAEWLPIATANSASLSVLDWHEAVKRCLSNAIIAVMTGDKVCRGPMMRNGTAQRVELPEIDKSVPW